MLTWISSNAKWVIYIFIVGILAGLLFMDMSQLQTDHQPPIVKVGEDRVILADFQARLEQIQQQQQQHDLTDAQNAEMRNEILHQFVQEKLLNQQIKALSLVGSDAELWSDLMNDPIPGVQKAPAFQTVVGADTTFDIAKYRAWLDTTIAGTITEPQLIEYREYLRNQKIPQRQLQMLVNAGFHPSTLEAQWTAAHSLTKFQVWVASAVVDSFPDVSIDSASIDAYYKAHTDSFFAPQDLARLKLVALPIEASKVDEASAREWTQMMLNQLKDGADFAELAKMNSEDEASSQLGGDIADPTAWGPEFAAAVATLDSGKYVTEPIRTSFGWQIAQSLGKADSNKVKIRHILVKVSASSETVDSVETLLKNMKEEVEAGKAFVDVAKANKMPVHETQWLTKSDEITGIGYLQGLSSYAFRNPEMPKTEDVSSQVLQNKKFVVFCVKSDSVKAGTRTLAPFRSYIASVLRTQKRLDAARNYLSSKMTEIANMPVVDSTTQSTIAKINLTAVEVNYEGFIPGLGYATPAIYRVLSKQPIGSWGAPQDGSGAAVAVKVLSKVDPDAAQLQQQVVTEIGSRWQFGAYSMFNDYLKNIEESARVVNNLDLYYQE